MNQFNTSKDLIFGGLIPQIPNSPSIAACKTIGNQLAAICKTPNLMLNLPSIKPGQIYSMPPANLTPFIIKPIHPILTGSDITIECLFTGSDL